MLQNNKLSDLNEALDSHYLINKATSVETPYKVMKPKIEGGQRERELGTRGFGSKECEKTF